MKANPLFSSEKEEREMIQKRDNFTFSDPVQSPKLVILIAGKEGSGKTHLSCSMSELGRVYVIDTEYRAQIVTRKFPNVKFKVVKSFDEMVVAIEHIIKHQPPGTIVIDSASDLQTFSEIEYLERTRMERVYPVFNWAEVWGLCNALIDKVKFSQKFHLVLTARLKEEYVNDKPTGQMVPRIYSTLPYKADIALQYTADKERKLIVTKNGFTGDLTAQVSRADTLPQIIQRLSQNVTTVLKKVI